MLSKALSVLLVVSCAALGCGGSSSGSAAAPACGNFVPCGGDLVGKWQVVDMCLDDAASLVSGAVDEPACKGLFRGVDVHASGSYEFTADGKSTESVTFTIDEDVLWTTACLSALANGAKVDLPKSCSQLETDTANNPNFQGASCMVVADGCSCIITSVEQNSNSSAAYTTDGSTFTDGSGDGASVGV